MPLETNPILTLRLDTYNEERAYREYSLLLDGNVIGIGIVRSRPSHAIDLPARAGAHIGYRIDERYRGRGFGKQWFRLLLHEARGIGLSGVIVAVDEHNLVSRKIIEASGGELFDRVEAGFTLLMYRIPLN